MKFPDIATAFRASEIPALGRTFKGLIDALGEIEVLNLEIGANYDWNAVTICLFCANQKSVRVPVL